MLDKVSIQTKLIENLNGKISAIENQLKALRNDLEGDTKSTAGDKHETSRAMIHLEQERLATQLAPLEKMKSLLSSIDSIRVHDTVSLGSLVCTTNGDYYLAVGYGKIEVDGQQLFCLSPSTPIAQLLLGKKPGETVQFNGKELLINDIR